MPTGNWQSEPLAAWLAAWLAANPVDVFDDPGGPNDKLYVTGVRI